MPFKSQAQMKFMLSQHPDIAKRWMNEHHQKMSNLPKKLRYKGKKKK